MPFFEGFVIGLGMIIFIGPVFFLLLNSSLQYGVKSGVSVAFGIIISDVVCVLLCYYGFKSFFENQQHQFWIGIIGSVILFVLGISYILKKVPTSIVNTFTPHKSILLLFVQGFSVNFFNPFVFAVWIGVLNYMQQKHQSNESSVLFISGVLIGILVLDLAKVFLASKVKNLISSEFLKKAYTCIGVLLLFFAFRLLYLVW